MGSSSKPQSSSQGLPESLPDTGADHTFVLGEYDCGNLDHEFSSRLIRFKDLRGTFGRRPDGQRLFQDYFASLLADCILGDNGPDEYRLAVPVPPKQGQNPLEYHLFDLASALEQELENRGESGRLSVLFDALRFTGEVPPVKSIRLPERPCALNSLIACTMDLSGQSVVLLDDIIASGATAAECIRALRKAGAARVVLVALARRVG